MDNPHILSNFIRKNALDRLKKNPTLSDGLKGILNELENKGIKDWKPFLSNIIDHIDSGAEPLADSNKVKDYLKQGIERQLPDIKQAKQTASDVQTRLRQYRDELKEFADLSPIASQHIEDSDLVKEATPSLKKYQEFKTKVEVFSDLVQCLQVNR